MRKKYKFFSMLTAFLCSVTLIGSVASLSSVALSYGDVNGDGVLSLSDTVALSQYLSGKGVLLDYAIADLNLNCVIDAVDSQILLAFIAEKIHELPYTS